MVAVVDRYYRASEKLGGITLSFHDLGPLLPITITVASAIVLFIIKEVLDFIKIRRSDGRKKVAIRTLIACHLSV
jgi:hypothetical protein